MNRPANPERAGFTLLEVMIAAALLSIVTAGAMAAFIAQSRVTNTQQETSQANDRAREAIRLISNDVRTAAAGIGPGSGGYAGCAAGAIPFDTGNPNASGTTVACLPPVFRSFTPLGPLPLSAGIMGTACGTISSPGYQLTFGGATPIVEPAASAYFCPDDLVVLAVDDANPLFMVQSAPQNSSVTNSAPLTFAGTNTPPRGGGSIYSGFGFDDGPPGYPLPRSVLPPLVDPLIPTGVGGPTMLFGGPSGAALMNVGCPNQGLGTVCAAPTPYSANSAGCTADPGCYNKSYGLVPTTPAIDLYGNNLDFGSVAMPARLVQYWIQPVNAQGGTTAGPFVSANLMRSIVVPQPNPYDLVQLSSTVLVEGVIDLQVEFGFPDPSTPPGTPGNGQLVYLSSGGLQQSGWQSPYLTATLPSKSLTITPLNPLCNGLGSPDPSIYEGVCFPTSGGQFNALTQLRTVRLNLTVRAGVPVASGQGPAQATNAAFAGYSILEPGVQGLGPNGNIEGQQWNFAAHGTDVNPTTGVFPSQDGANYRQISTEIYLRNVGWTNNL